MCLRISNKTHSRVTFIKHTKAFMKTIQTLLAVALAGALSACGGGGSAASVDGTGSGANGAGGNSVSGSGGSNGEAIVYAFQPTIYSVFKHGVQAQWSGLASNRTATSSTLELWNAPTASTTLTQTNVAAPSNSTVTASNSNFHVVSRNDGAVLMLCDSLPAGGKVGNATKSRYVALGTTSDSEDTTAVQLTNATDLAGQTLYALEDCSFTDSASGLPQGQNTTPNANSSRISFAANGSATTSGGASLSASQLTSLFNGTPITNAQSTIGFSAYRVNVGGIMRYFMVERGTPLSGTGAGYVSLWVMN